MHRTYNVNSRLFMRVQCPNCLMAMIYELNTEITTIKSYISCLQDDVFPLKARAGFILFYFRYSDGCGSTKERSLLKSSSFRELEKQKVD